MNYLIRYNVYVYDKAIKEKLESEGIKCTSINTGDENAAFFVFEIMENDKNISKVNEIIPEITSDERLEEIFRNREDDAPVVMAFYFSVYTEEERSNAKWLELCPMTMKIDPVNEEQAFTMTCIFKQTRRGIDVGRHYIQSSPCEIQRAVKWGNSQFFSGTSIGFNSLFCSDRAAVLMQQAGLRGLGYGPVLKKGTRVPVANVRQVKPEHTIANHAFVPVRDMEEYTCEICGMKMLRMTGQRSLYGIRESYIDPEIDIFETLPLFAGLPSLGDRTPSEARSKFIISQRAYQALKKNAMCRGVEFTPLETFP